MRDRIERMKTPLELTRSVSLSVAAVFAGLALFSSPVWACSTALGSHAQAVPPALVNAFLKATPPPTAAPASANPVSIVGMWKAVFQSEGVVADVAFESWFADGNELLIDALAPATDNVCSGTWVQTGDGKYELNHPSWDFDLNGNLLGIVSIRETVELSPDGNSYSGTSTVDCIDTSGNHVCHEAGSVTASRISAN